MEVIDAAGDGFLNKLSNMLLNIMGDIFKGTTSKKESIKDSDGNIGGRYWMPLDYDSNSRVIVDVYPIDKSKSDDKTKSFLVEKVKLIYTGTGKNIVPHEVNLEPGNFASMCIKNEDVLKQKLGNATQEDICKKLLQVFQDTSKAVEDNWKEKVVNEDEIESAVNAFISSQISSKGLGILKDPHIKESTSQFWIIDEKPATFDNDGNIQMESSDDSQDASQSSDEDMNDQEGDDNVQEASAAKKIRCNLRKISGSSEIELSEIQTNCSPKDTWFLIEQVADCPESCSLISQDGTCFEILDDGCEDIDVQVVDTVDTSKTLSVLFDYSIGFMSNLYAVKFGCIDKDVNNIIDNVWWISKDITDNLGKFMIREESCYPNPGIARINAIDNSNGFNKQSGLLALDSIISGMIDMLDIYYVNVPHEIQSVFDSWINSLKDTKLQIKSLA